MAEPNALSQAIGVIGIPLAIGFIGYKIETWLEKRKLRDPNYIGDRRIIYLDRVEEKFQELTGTAPRRPIRSDYLLGYGILLRESINNPALRSVLVQEFVNLGNSSYL